MPVIVSCQCGQQFATQERHIGKRVACPMCGRPLKIGDAPAPPPPPSAPPPPKVATIRAVCPCGRSFLAPVALQGTTMTCPGCHEPVVVPTADPLGIGDLVGLPGTADPLALPPVRDDSTEKLAFQLAYLAAGSVGLLAVAIILTSLFQNIARVWTTPPTTAQSPPRPTAAPTADGSKATSSLAPILAEPLSPFTRAPASSSSAPSARSPAAPPPPPVAAESAPSGSSARANLSGARTDSGPLRGILPASAEQADSGILRLSGAAQSWHSDSPGPLRGLRRARAADTPVMGFSWLAELLPILDQQPLYDRLNFSQPVTSRGNLQVGTTLIPEFINPLDDRQRWTGYPFDGLALTHFAGMSGVEDSRTVVAAKLPRSDPRAGVFGYDEVTRPTEIADGTSQTIMIVGTGAMANPWLVGGGGTVRGAREPLFDLTSGLGTKGLSSGGSIVVMADGSVRHVSPTIDPRTFKAMCTIRGAESVDVEHAAPLASAANSSRF